MRLGLTIAPHRAARREAIFVAKTRPDAAWSAGARVGAQHANPKPSLMQRRALLPLCQAVSASDSEPGSLVKASLSCAFMVLTGTCVCMEV